MSREFWNHRYTDEESAYGDEPIGFVAEYLPLVAAPPARVLDVGAGEGRNAVWAARLGYRVTAVDFAAQGLRRIQERAARAGVSVDCIEADVTAWQPDAQWDVVVLAFLHLSSRERPDFWKGVQRLVRPGGTLLGQWFAPGHLARQHVGGPRDPDLIASLDEVRRALDGGVFERLVEVEADQGEGRWHRGPGVTIQAVWRRSPEGALST